MSVIAWDGTTLAADKRSCFGTLCTTVTKIFRINGKTLAGYTGDAAFGEQILAWYRAGAEPGDFPASQRDKDDWARLIVIKSGEGIFEYERTPCPLRNEAVRWAWGSGRDFALAAMHLGKSAREAVEVACLFDSGSGNGVDVLQPAPIVRVACQIRTPAGHELIASSNTYLGDDPIHIAAREAVECLERAIDPNDAKINGPKAATFEVFGLDGHLTERKYSEFSVRENVCHTFINESSQTILAAHFMSLANELVSDIRHARVTGKADAIVWRLRPQISLIDKTVLVMRCRLGFIAHGERLKWPFV